MEIIMLMFDFAKTISQKQYQFAVTLMEPTMKRLILNIRHEIFFIRIVESHFSEEHFRFEIIATRVQIGNFEIRLRLIVVPLAVDHCYRKRK